MSEKYRCFVKCGSLTVGPKKFASLEDARQWAEQYLFLERGSGLVREIRIEEAKEVVKHVWKKHSQYEHFNPKG